MRSRLVALLLCSALCSCAAWRRRNDGQHLEATKKHEEPSTETRAMQAQVTTDAAGNITDIRVVKSSGRPGADGFVLETIRSNWPSTPSRRIVVEVKQSPATGFSEPRVISNVPAS